MESGRSASSNSAPTGPPLKESMETHRPIVSKRLVELVQPHFDDSMTLREYEALVGLGAVAWNLSLFPAEDRQKELSRAVAELQAEPQMQRETAELIEDLQRRKGLLFPSDHRLIVEWEVEDRGCGRYLVLAASLVDGGPEY